MQPLGVDLVNSIRATAIRGCAGTRPGRGNPPAGVRRARFCEKNSPEMLDAIQRLGDGYHPLGAGGFQHADPGSAQQPAWSTILRSREVARLWRAATRCCTPVTRRDLRPGRTRSDGQRHSGGGGARRGTGGNSPGALRRTLRTEQRRDAMACAVRELFSHDVEQRGQRCPPSRRAPARLGRGGRRSALHYHTR